MTQYAQLGSSRSHWHWITNIDWDALVMACGREAHRATPYTDEPPPSTRMCGECARVQRLTKEFLDRNTGPLIAKSNEYRDIVDLAVEYFDQVDRHQESKSTLYALRLALAERDY